MDLTTPSCDSAPRSQTHTDEGGPFYLHLSGPEWEEKIAFLRDNFSPCRLCPRCCGALRSENKVGVCRVGPAGAGEAIKGAVADAAGVVKIASYNLHFGEEPPISGTRGSGTVFFSGCTMKCIFCQNYPISHLYNGNYYTVAELSRIFLDLQARGAHNINFVSPTPYLYHLVRALYQAREQGLRIPIVYNTSGYERPEILRALRHIVDIYLPDYKYDDDGLARQFSGVGDYTRFVYGAIEEMFAQAGDWFADADGIGIHGLIIRHLLLPGHLENSKQVLQRIAAAPFKEVHLSLMSQYFPAYKAADHAVVGRQVTLAEYEEIEDYALDLGFENGWFQDPQAKGGA